jgi:hypothetical protein
MVNFLSAFKANLESELLFLLFKLAGLSNLGPLSVSSSILIGISFFLIIDLILAIVFIVTVIAVIIIITP